MQLGGGGLFNAQRTIKAPIKDPVPLNPFYGMWKKNVEIYPLSVFW